ncbi:MAG: signal recognition particle-docking protein FtsY [Candidatus Neomarinimicrobiota bacterium]|nr:MAG: signal recognition particle-docking protein FtsY [Candidatus Neomarinimicrobiota bacterium]
MPLSTLVNALKNTRSVWNRWMSRMVSQKLSDEDLEQLEEDLLLADLGMDTTAAVIDLVEKNRRRWDGNAIRTCLIDLLREGTVDIDSALEPLVFIVGVNGTGKTTTIAKLAAFCQTRGEQVLLVGADTYRAAAVQQLEIWSRRLGVRLVANTQSRDPASVVYDGLSSVKAHPVDRVLVDTAGRLHTATNLMQELEKMFRTVRTHFPDQSYSTLLTVDANLGQNALSQVKQFQEYVKIDGIILTKLDGTAKGGIIFPIIREYHLPVWFVGVGEGLEDLEIFRPERYVEGLWGHED